jgi:hypothetical protein
MPQIAGYLKNGDIEFLDALGFDGPAARHAQMMATS